MLNVGLHGLEGSGAAKTNAGFFEKGILNAFESDHRNGGSALEVKAVGNGHSHSKQYVLPWPDMLTRLNSHGKL